ncbi:MAG TPA: hypothetical protein VK569_05205 [Bacteroidota bacterium]|nr:hypothetical protein [Bacteroidota bacterium]
MHTHLWFTIISFHVAAAYIPLSALLLYRRPSLWPYLASLFNGVLVGYIDIGASEVQVTALLLLAFAFFSGFASPRAAWRWGLMTGIWVPAFHIGGMWIQSTPPIPRPEAWGSLLALAFAFAGAYGGRFIRSAAAGTDEREHSPREGSTTGKGEPGRTP